MAKKQVKTIASPMPQRTSVDVRTADNGFVVSSWGPKGERVFIAKTMDEAKAFAAKLLGGSEKK